MDWVQHENIGAAMMARKLKRIAENGRDSGTMSGIGEEAAQAILNLRKERDEARKEVAVFAYEKRLRGEYFLHGWTGRAAQEREAKRSEDSAPGFRSGCAGNYTPRAIPEQIPSVPQADGDAGISEVAQSRGFKEAAAKGPEWWEIRGNDPTTGRRANATGKPESGDTVALQPSLLRQVQSLLDRNEQLEKWLNDAATTLGCDLDRVSHSVKNMMSQNQELVQKLVKEEVDWPHTV